ncbi:hypothetical protein MFLO_01895 [Listeria floridensis FSL S10-1187]|uniref:Uncharacterized protein n=1 Tax=Listeria floridensis FSL S10-1187 TaxID=1265817 RepID=A0ABN0RIW7_9LIST|nr:hypothetical protein MFLO_01895 [Listeria floridensis FSL S10-1187]
MTEHLGIGESRGHPIDLPLFLLTVVTGLFSAYVINSYFMLRKNVAMNEYWFGIYIGIMLYTLVMILVNFYIKMSTSSVIEWLNVFFIFLNVLFWRMLSGKKIQMELAILLTVYLLLICVYLGFIIIPYIF